MKDWHSGYHSVPRHGETVAAGQDLSEKNTESESGRPDMDTLLVEKALQDVRGLQGELAAFGVPVELEDSDADGTVAAVRIPSLYGETEQTIQLDGRVCERGHQAETFEEHRLFTINSLVRYYEHKPRIIEDRWEWLCDGADEPLPVFLQVRMEKLGDVAEKLRGLVREED